MERLRARGSNGMMAPTVAYDGATHDKQFLAQTISATTLIVTKILTDNEKKPEQG